MKFPGATADLIATKNLFDVFVKERVMTVCEEVIRDSVVREGVERGKENSESKK